MTLLLFAIGAGLLWHGLQIVWVAPTPSLIRNIHIKKSTRDDSKNLAQGLDVASQATKSSPIDEQLETAKLQARNFQIFWLDQYAWIGIVLSAFGISLLGWGMAAL